MVSLDKEERSWYRFDELPAGSVEARRTLMGNCGSSGEPSWASSSVLAGRPSSSVPGRAAGLGSGIS
jgi:hypothetical protein